MKKNILKIMPVMLILTFIFAGCGAFNKTENETKDWDYQNPNVAWKQVHQNSEDTYIGDWTISEGNDIAVKMKPELSIFTIFVNPVAGDEVMDEYVKLALRMDEVFSENKEYKNYCKKNAPYFIEFVSHSGTIATMDLDGKNDSEQLKQTIADSLQADREQMTVALEEFRNNLDNRKDINRDDAGNYYYILDTTDFSVSLAEIRSSLQEIYEICPINGDETGHYVSSEKIQGSNTGYYNIYMDEFGGDMIKTSASLEANYDFKFGFDPSYLFGRAYANLIETGTIDKENGFSCYYVAFQDEMRISLESVPGDTFEETIDEIYGWYEEVVSLHEKYGIQYWMDLEINGQYDNPDDPTYFCMVNTIIPMDKKLTREEFEKYYMEGCEFYPQGYFELPDDCE